MTTPEATTDEPPPNEAAKSAPAGPSLAARAHKACGVVAGAYVVAHVAFYAMAAWGPWRVAAALAKIARVRPAIDAVVGIAVVVYGLGVLVRAVRGGDYPAFGGGRTKIYWAARGAAAGTILFGALHAWDARLRFGRVGLSDLKLTAVLSARFAATAWSFAWFAFLFMVGLACTATHMAVTWIESAHARSPLDGARRRRVQFLAFSIASLVLVAGIVAVLAYATGLRLGSLYSTGYLPSAPCPQ